jgi:hypothetical protein
VHRKEIAIGTMDLQCVTTPGQPKLGWREPALPEQALPLVFVLVLGSEDAGNDMMSVCGVNYQVLGNVGEEVFENSDFCFLMCRAKPAKYG